MMTSCLRPHRLAPLVCALISVLRCCSRSWRSWPVSATRLMGASWRSWPSWIATSCGVPRARGRWRRWWPGRPARHRETPTRSPPWRAGWRRSRAARQGMREGRLSLDQVGVIAGRAAEGSDEHYAALAGLRNGGPAAHRGQAGTATPTRFVGQNRSPRSPRPPTRSSAAGGSNFGHLDAAKFDAALQSHRDALIAEWKHDRDKGDREIRSGAPGADRRRGVYAAGRDGMGRRGRPAGPTGSTPPW